MNVSISSRFTNIPFGGVASPDESIGFTNIFPSPILVNSIVFTWFWTVPSRTSVNTYGTPMSDVLRVRMDYGNQPLTNGFVPIDLLGRSVNWRTTAPSIIIAGQVTETCKEWRFPHPLWLPPNQQIRMQVQHQNDFAIGVKEVAQTVSVTMRGYLDESDIIPQWIDIPYATAYLGTIWGAAGASTGVEPMVTEQNKPTDLFNPFAVPLCIDHFKYLIGVSSNGLNQPTSTVANFAPTCAVDAQDQTSLNLIGQNYGLDRRYVRIKMTSSTGRSLIKDFAPIGSIISSAWRRLDTKAILDPAQYYVAILQSQMPLFVARNTGLAFQMRTDLGMLATRRLTPAEALVTYSVV